MTQMINGKKPWLSRTFWAAIMTIALGALQAAKDVIPQAYVGQLLLVIGIVSLVLRFLTDQPISLD